MLYYWKQLRMPKTAQQSNYTLRLWSTIYFHWLLCFYLRIRQATEHFDALIHIKKTNQYCIYWYIKLSFVLMNQSMYVLLVQCCSNHNHTYIQRIQLKHVHQLFFALMWIYKILVWYCISIAMNTTSISCVNTSNLIYNHLYMYWLIHIMHGLRIIIYSCIHYLWKYIFYYVIPVDYMYSFRNVFHNLNQAKNTKNTLKLYFITWIK